MSQELLNNVMEYLNSTKSYIVDPREERFVDVVIEQLQENYFLFIGHDDYNDTIIGIYDSEDRLNLSLNSHIVENKTGYSFPITICFVIKNSKMYFINYENGGFSIDETNLSKSTILSEAKQNNKGNL